MSIPISLPSGYILVYGESLQSPSGMVVENTNFRFGSVYQIWSGGGNYIYGGDMVMFDREKVETRLAYPQSEYLNYSLIQMRLVTKQEPLL